MFCDGPIRLGEHHWPEPDFALFPASIFVDEVRGPDLFLLIEIADSSLSFDLGWKAQKYRDYGVREYWVVDLAARVTHVHLLDAGWPEKSVVFDAPLAPQALPGLALRLADYEA